jgi:hypothetical protein
MNTGKQNHTLSDQQRQQILAVLSSEGVTQPTDISRLKMFTAAMIKLLVVFGVWALILGLTGLLDQKGSVNGIFVFIMLLIVSAWLAVKFAIPAIKPVIGAQLRWGQNASHAIMRSKIAPVLYLRSFQFDSTGQRGALENVEMALAIRIAGRIGANGAPLLAIGKPNELDPLPGALRFWVRHDLWQEKIAAIAPLCSLVIWTTGHTEGLDWEIQYLTKNIEPTKILLWLHAQFSTSKTERDIEWAKFVERYKDVFPQALPASIDEIRFIAFDEQWTPIPIPGKQFPASFAERHLAKGKGQLTNPGLGNFLNARIR